MFAKGNLEIRKAVQEVGRQSYIEPCIHKSQIFPFAVH